MPASSTAKSNPASEIHPIAGTLYSGKERASANPAPSESRMRHARKRGFTQSFYRVWPRRTAIRSPGNGCSAPDDTLEALIFQALARGIGGLGVGVGPYLHAIEVVVAGCQHERGK